MLNILEVYIKPNFMKTNNNMVINNTNLAEAFRILFHYQCLNIMIELKVFYYIYSGKNLMTNAIKIFFFSIICSLVGQIKSKNIGIIH